MTGSYTAHGLFLCAVAFEPGAAYAASDDSAPETFIRPPKVRSIAYSDPVYRAADLPEAYPG